MPMHNWTQVEPTIFHHFHQRWSIAIVDALNAGLLPSGLSALIEQHRHGMYALPTIDSWSNTVGFPTSELLFAHASGYVGLSI